MSQTHQARLDEFDASHGSELGSLRTQSHSATACGRRCIHLGYCPAEQTILGVSTRSIGTSSGSRRVSRSTRRIGLSHRTTRSTRTSQLPMSAGRDRAISRRRVAGDSDRQPSMEALSDKAVMRATVRGYCSARARTSRASSSVAPQSWWCPSDTSRVLSRTISHTRECNRAFTRPEATIRRNARSAFAWMPS